MPMKNEKQVRRVANKWDDLIESAVNNLADITDTVEMDPTFGKNYGARLVKVSKQIAKVLARLDSIRENLLMEEF